MASETTKAYNNLEFLSSPEARTIRMLSEYIHPIKTFAENKIEGTIVFFGSARIPVSYTHLRAHETVLDLVCRLLLENNSCSTSKTITRTLVPTELTPHKLYTDT